MAATTYVITTSKKVRKIAATTIQSNIFSDQIGNIWTCISTLQTCNLNHPSILLFSHGQATKPCQVSVRIGINCLTLLKSCLNSKQHVQRRSAAMMIRSGTTM
jgi:hypothetical protein